MHGCCDRALQACTLSLATLHYFMLTVEAESRRRTRKSVTEVESSGAYGGYVSVVASYGAGKRVAVGGLAKNVTLNGKQGVVQHGQRDDGRITVLLDGSLKPQAFKKANLVAVHDSGVPLHTPPEKENAAANTNTKKHQ